MEEQQKPQNGLSSLDGDFHRALLSLKEEIEAVDWYHQRVVNTSDKELKTILAHNRDEEIEHACMTLEWLRKNMPAWGENLRTYLFKDTSVTDVEKYEKSSGFQGSKSRELSIGSLKNNILSIERN